MAQHEAYIYALPVKFGCNDDILGEYEKQIRDRCAAKEIKRISPILEARDIHLRLENKYHVVVFRIKGNESSIPQALIPLNEQPLYPTSCKINPSQNLPDGLLMSTARHTGLSLTLDPDGDITIEGYLFQITWFQQIVTDTTRKRSSAASKKEMEYRPPFRNDIGESAASKKVDDNTDMKTSEQHTHEKHTTTGVRPKNEIDASLSKDSLHDGKVSFSKYGKTKNTDRNDRLERTATLDGPSSSNDIATLNSSAISKASDFNCVSVCTSFGRAEYMRVFNDKQPLVNFSSGMYYLEYPENTEDETFCQELLAQLVEYEISVAMSHLNSELIEQIISDLNEQYKSDSILVCKNAKTGVVHIVGPTHYPIGDITKAACDVLKVVKGSRTVLPDGRKVKEIDQNQGQNQYVIPRIPNLAVLLKSKHIDTHLYVDRKTHFKTGDITVYLDKADITNIPVDCIVNAANERMIHGSGVARAISDAAGPEFKRYCKLWIDMYGKIPKGGVAVTPVFQLTKCHHCIHVVGPKWGDYKDKQQCSADLETCVIECLKMAEKLRHKSIALPPISAGVFKVPKNVVFDAIYYGISEYSTNTDCKIRYVHIVDNNKETINFFDSCLRQLMGMERGSSKQHAQQAGETKGPPNRQFSEYRQSYNTSPTSTSEDEPMDTGESSYMTGSVGRARRPSDSLGASHNVPVFTRRHPDTDKGATASKVTGETDDKDDDETCVICMDEFDAKTKKLKCGHKFCEECIDLAFKSKPVCPTCGKLYGKLTGNQPHGQMIPTRHKEDIPGYPGCGHIKIVYSFNNGTQTEEHPNPGVRYTGISRTAYLPNNAEGQKVLRLLDAAFKARLTFTIGRSTTTGRDNQITWNDIHHKTNIHGGPQAFGYPDPDYLQRVQDELADKGIKE